MNPGIKSRACPLCRRPTHWEENPWRPFCSARCQEIDLGRWALESYRVALPGMDPDGLDGFNGESGEDRSFPQVTFATEETSGE